MAWPFRISVLLFLWWIVAPSLVAAGLRVQIEGIEGEVRTNVLARLSLARLAEEPGEIDAFRIRRFHRRARDEIREALAPFGFYHPRIESELIEKEADWVARFRIDPGDPVRVTRLDLRLTGEGREDPLLRAALDAFPLRPGDPARHDRYEAGKKRLLQAALEAGYRDAHWIEHRLRIDVDRNEARITLVLDTGPRYRFGPVRFLDPVLDPALLEGYVPFRRGEPYSPGKLLSLQRALERTGYFSVVDIAPAPVPAGQREIPVRVRLVLAKPNRYLLGLGYGTDTGFRLRLGWQRRYIGRRGHRFDLDLALSGIRQEAHASYRIPWSHPRTDVVQFSAGLGDRSTTSNDAIVRVLGVKRHQMRGKWQQEFGLRAESTTYRVGSDSGTTRLLVPAYEIRRLQQPRAGYLRSGGRIGLEVAGAAEALASDVSFLRLRIEGKRIVPVGKAGRLLLRARLGTLSTSDFSRMPPAYRFFAGGDQSVRGYAFESLGPRDAEGHVTGGRQLVEGSIEYQHRIWRDLGVALFLDIGNAVDRLGDPLRRGAGFGVRWSLPVGTAGIDLAFALSEPGTPWRIHVTLGPDL